MKNPSDSSTVPLDVLTPEAFASALNERARMIVPEHPPTRTVIDRLTPHRSALIALRKQGYSLGQIATLLKAPEFGVHVSHMTLRRLIERAPRRRSSATDAVRYVEAETVAENASGD